MHFRPAGKADQDRSRKDSIILGSFVVFAVIALHLGLAIWAGAGLVEWIAGGGPWPRLTNPELPRTILLLHWSVPLATATIFLLGFALKWPPTPLLCAIGYALMAAICALETTSFLTGPNRFAAMGVEFAAYAALGIMLFKLQTFRQHFQLDAI